MSNRRFSKIKEINLEKSTSVLKFSETGLGSQIKGNTSSVSEKDLYNKRKRAKIKQLELELERKLESLEKKKKEAEEEIHRKYEELKRKEENLKKKMSGYQKEPDLDPSKLKDAYQILGVEAGLTLVEYKKAYYDICKKYDPNRVANMGKELWELTNLKLQLINLAWETIKTKI
jgi:DnaJ-domain-containing protein 1